MSESVEIARKRALYRAWHRGAKEVDLILGPFATAHVARLAPAQVARFEALLDETDADLYDWVAGRRPVPARLDTDVMRLLKTFVAKRGRQPS